MRGKGRRQPTQGWAGRRKPARCCQEQGRSRPAFSALVNGAFNSYATEPLTGQGSAGPAVSSAPLCSRQGGLALPAPIFLVLYKEADVGARHLVHASSI